MSSRFVIPVSGKYTLFRFDKRNCFPSISRDTFSARPLNSSASIAVFRRQHFSCYGWGSHHVRLHRLLFLSFPTAIFRFCLFSLPLKHRMTQSVFIRPAAELCANHQLRQNPRWLFIRLRRFCERTFRRLELLHICGNLLVGISVKPTPHMPDKFQFLTRHTGPIRGNQTEFRQLPAEPSTLQPRHRVSWRS